MEDFEGPSFSLGLDFDFDTVNVEAPKEPHVLREEAPSFSLGLDLDLDLDFETNPVTKEAPECSINVSSQSFEKDETFHQETLVPDVYIDDPPPVLKRLKRGPPPHPSQSSAVKKKKRDPMFVSSNVDDDIEDFSSQEDLPKDKRSAVQNRSVWSSSKVPLHGHRVVTTQSVTKQTSQKDTPSNASTIIFEANKKDTPSHGHRVVTTQSVTKQTSQKDTPSNTSTISFEANKNCTMFPRLTISPLRKFQLVDSDSDDPSAIDVPRKDVNMVNASGMKRHCYPSQSVSGIQQKKANISASTLKNVDLWKEFTPKKSVNIQTPALDEFCEEYFRSVKDTNVGKGKEDMCPSSSKTCSQKKSIDDQYGNHPDPDSVPPAYRYFYHDDLRIQRLVRYRLPYFFPLGAAGNQLDKQSDATAIDYMSQFGQKDNPTQVRGNTNKDLGQTSQRGRKNSKKLNAKEAAEGSANWVSPKSCVNIPKDAGKRRVHANNQSSGHWYFDHDGKKVYMSKTGQVLTGRMAYSHYKKESGAGFRKSRKRTTSKKKPK